MIQLSFVKLCVKFLLHVAHGMTHRAPHHVAQAGMTRQAVAPVRQAGTVVQVLLARQAGRIAQAQAIHLHQAGINHVGW